MNPEATSVVATAFVFINITPGTETEVLRRLRESPEIKESYFVYGVYDVIAKVEADSLDRLKELITWKIRKLDNVKSTTTAIVGESNKSCHPSNSASSIPTTGRS